MNDSAARRRRGGWLGGAAVAAILLLARVLPGGEALPQESHAFDFPVRTADLGEHELLGLVEPLLGRCLAPLVEIGRAHV